MLLGQSHRRGDVELPGLDPTKLSVRLPDLVLANDDAAHPAGGVAICIEVQGKIAQIKRYLPFPEVKRFEMLYRVHSEADIADWMREADADRAARIAMLILKHS